MAGNDLITTNESDEATFWNGSKFVCQCPEWLVLDFYFVRSSPDYFTLANIFFILGAGHSFLRKVLYVQTMENRLQ